MSPRCLPFSSLSFFLLSRKRRKRTGKVTRLAITPNSRDVQFPDSFRPMTLWFCSQNTINSYGTMKRTCELAKYFPSKLINFITQICIAQRDHRGDKDVLRGLACAQQIRFPCFASMETQSAQRYETGTNYFICVF